MLCQDVIHLLVECSSLISWNNSVSSQDSNSVLSLVEAVQLWVYTHVVSRSDVTIFTVSVYVQSQVLTLVEDWLDQVFVSVESEDNWRSWLTEQSVELVIWQSALVVHLTVLVLQTVQLNNVDITHLYRWECIVNQVQSSQSFDRWLNTSRCEDDVSLLTFSNSWSPVNSLQTFSCQFLSFFNWEPLLTWLLWCNNVVNLVTLSKCTTEYSQQWVSIGWQVLANEVRLLFSQVRQHTRILVSVTVVVLLEYSWSWDQVQWWVIVTPWLLWGVTQPLEVLCNHWINYT